MCNWQGYSTKDQVRCRATFRRHIQSPCHPRGEIVRQPCHYCGKQVSCWHGSPAVADPIEGHHVDYLNPFAVVWVCFADHRAIERGEIVVKVSRPVVEWVGGVWAVRFGDVLDYTIAVHIRPHKWALGKESAVPALAPALEEAVP